MKPSHDLKFLFDYQLVKKGMALDIGCGSGRDSIFLADNGMDVTSIDMINAFKFTSSKVNFIQSRIEDFEFEEYSLVNAQWVLPFVKHDRFEGIVHKIKKKLTPGGVFLGQFFGLEDQWNKEGKDIVFVSKAKVLKMLFGLDQVKLADIRIQGYEKTGRPKFWHYYEFICRKP